MDCLVISFICTIRGRFAFVFCKTCLFTSKHASTAKEHLILPIARHKFSSLTNLFWYLIFPVSISIFLVLFLLFLFLFPIYFCTTIFHFSPTFSFSFLFSLILFSFPFYLCYFSIFFYLCYSSFSIFIIQHGNMR